MMTMNAMHTQIIGAYELALAGRNPASVDVTELLPAIELAVPLATIPDIIAALEAAAAQHFAEADALDDYRHREFGANDNGRPQ
jgi:hypothetical protein